MGDQLTRVLSLPRRRVQDRAASLMLALVAAVFGIVLATAAVAAADTTPGDNIRLPNNDMIEAARDGDVDAIHLAIMHGLSPDDNGIDFVPALVVATDYGHADAVRYLLKQGAHPNLKARDGRTALAVAAQAGRADIASALLDAGADPNQVAQNRDTPLLIAVRAHRTSVVQALLEHKVDLDDTDVTGRTALDLSEEHNFDDITTLLRRAENGE
ncbi:MAG TPA: ankyrin repeat domain-containing protein [Parvibaculum sp.]